MLVWWITMTAGLSTTLAVWLLRPLAVNLGLTDHPNDRKKHQGDVPLVGGLAIFLGFAIASVSFGFHTQVRGLLLGGAILVAVGVADDRKEISPAFRLLAQIAAALVMCWADGVVVREFGALTTPGQNIALGGMAVPFTVFATVALINSVNMSDGLDGLAGSQTLIALGGLAIVLLIAGPSAELALLLMICGCLTSFLAFNLRTPWRPRAAVFLGDAGSYLLGFVLAWFLIRTSQGPSAALAPAAVLWFVSLQVFETVEVVVRRLVRRQSPFGADREHLHHVFLLAGFSVKQTVAAMALLAFGGVAVGIWCVVVAPPEGLVMSVFVLCGALFLGAILRTWEELKFLRRSINRRQGIDRRRYSTSSWSGPDRRMGCDRRQSGLPVGAEPRTPIRIPTHGMQLVEAEVYGEEGTREAEGRRWHAAELSRLIDSPHFRHGDDARL